MQHRVKNNFQIILASIAIQKRRNSASDAHRALDHIASRINAISLVHDQLAPREEGQIVNLSDYLRALCLSIKKQAEEIEVDVQADELELSIDRAVPLSEDDWNCGVCRFHTCCCTSVRNDHRHLSADEFCRDPWNLIILIVRPAIVDSDVLALDESRFVQALSERTDKGLGASRRCWSGGNRPPASPAALA
jgi:hypothetical protein